MTCKVQKRERKRWQKRAQIRNEEDYLHNDSKSHEWVFEIESEDITC